MSPNSTKNKGTNRMFTRKICERANLETINLFETDKIHKYKACDIPSAKERM